MDREINSYIPGSCWSIEGVGVEPSQAAQGVKYFDDVWVIHEADGGAVYEVDFDRRFGDLTTWQRQVSKNLFSQFCSEFNGKLTFKCGRSIFEQRASEVKIVFQHLNADFPNRLLSDLGDAELIRLALFNQDGSLSGGRTAYARVRLLSIMFSMQFRSDCFVPSKYLPAHDVSVNWESLAVEFVKEAGQSVVEWKMGGSFAIVPFEVSLAILAYCIDLINSDETKYILALYQAERALRKAGVKPTHTAVGMVLSDFGALHGKRPCVARLVDQAFFDELRSYYPNAETREDLPLVSIPFRLGTNGTKNSLYQRTDHILMACFIALLILTGIRQSEARSMKSDSLSKKANSYTFLSNIDKTNHGVVTERDISGIGADFVNILDGLGSFGFGHERRPDLMSYVRYSYSGKNFLVYSLAKHGFAVSKKTNDFYEIFLEGQGKDIREYCPHIIPHGLRHAWAEFAMRRFDGNIMPLIRDHYRHHFGSRMTQVYTHGKIELSEYQDLGKRHIFELVSRYIDGAAMLYGQMGEFLMKEADKIGFLEKHDKGERDEVINQIIEEHMGEPIITPHEYGLCILTENKRRLANCRDGSGIPQTETAEIDKCAGCINSCMVKQTDGKEDTHFLTLKRLLAVYKAEAIQWEDNYLIGPLFVEESKKTARAIQAVVDKMEKTGD